MQQSTTVISRLEGARKIRTMARGEKATKRWGSAVRCDVKCKDITTKIGRKVDIPSLAVALQTKFTFRYTAR